VWTQIATATDESRILRLGLAWQQALGDARPGFAGEIRKEGVLLEPRAALPAILLLCAGGRRPADHRQADRQPASGGSLVGGRQARPAGLPRQPGAWR